MAAGGFRTFIAGEILDEDKINDFLMQGILVFDDAAARDAAITSPVEGQFAFLKDTDGLTFHDGTSFVDFETGEQIIQSLVVAGGGGGGFSRAGGGGAGGHLETLTQLVPGGYTVTVGAGGDGGIVGNQFGKRGNISQFGDLVAGWGGGGGDAGDARNDVVDRSTTGAGGVTAAASFRVGGVGASGGGAGQGFSVAAQGGPSTGFGGKGFAGGNNQAMATGSGDNFTGGGGGAGAVGENATAVKCGNGGVGVSSSITGSAVTRAGGGGGGTTIATPGTIGTGGVGGGGDGGQNAAGQNATVNTGGGGGGGGSGGAGNNGGNGGSGVVILKYPDSITLTIGAGLTSSTATAGGFKVTTFTAGTDTVTIP